MAAARVGSTQRRVNDGPQRDDAKQHLQDASDEDGGGRPAALKCMDDRCSVRADQPALGTCRVHTGKTAGQILGRPPVADPIPPPKMVLKSGALRKKKRAQPRDSFIPGVSSYSIFKKLGRIGMERWNWLQNPEDSLGTS